MKKKEFEAIGKKLVPVMPGFAVKGHLLFMQPIGHTLRAIWFDGSSDPRSFYAEIFLQPLFVPEDDIALTLGWRLRHSNGVDGWNADVLDLIPELSERLVREAIPFLSGIQTPRDVATVAMAKWGPSENEHVFRAIGYALARAGDVERAIPVLERIIRIFEQDGREGLLEMAAQDRALISQLANDPPAAQRQFDVWEAQTVRNLKLEEFWCGGNVAK